MVEIHPKAHPPPAMKWIWQTVLGEKTKCKLFTMDDNRWTIVRQVIYMQEMKKKQKKQEDHDGLVLS